MKRYLSPEFEVIKLLLSDVVCSSVPTDPLENNEGDQNWGDDGD